MKERETGCIIMASGLSERYGRNKLLEKLEGREVILHTVGRLRAAGFRPLTVTRSEEVRALLEREGFDCVLHNGPKKSDTIHAGLERLGPGMTGYLFMPGDQPLVRPASLKRMREQFLRCPERAVRLGFRGIAGSPVIFPGSCREKLMAYTGERGGLEVLKREGIPCDITEAESEEELWDVDTPEKMEQVRQALPREKSGAKQKTEEKRMYLTEDGIRLNAKLDMPEGHGGKCPLVIVIHGFTGHMEERHIIAVAKALNEAGCATLRVDMYGHGNSEGSFEKHTLYKWLTNVMTAVDYARSLDFVTEIYLCGHSQGGLTVMLAAAMERDVISGVIPLSPACMIPDLARKGTLLGLNFDPEHIPEVLPAWGDRGLGGNYVRVAQTIHVEEAIDRYSGPVLLVHGDADETVPTEYGIEAAKRYRNCKLVLIPGDTHCFDHHLEMVTEAVADWIRERTGKA